MEHFPITKVWAFSRRTTTAQRFAAEVKDIGLEAVVSEDPKDVVAGSDIIITSTPVVPPTTPFIDAEWLAPGSFAGMVDLGFSWIKEKMHGFSCVVTDDTAQAGSEGLAYTKPYQGEVADLVSGTVSGRHDESETHCIGLCRHRPRRCRRCGGRL